MLNRCLTSVCQEAVADRGSKSSRTDGVGRLADVDPISLDTSIRFSNVGGLEEHVRCLQEMVVFPILYSEVFSKFHVTPPKGVLFHGPPGIIIHNIFIFFIFLLLNLFMLLKKVYFKNMLRLLFVRILISESIYFHDQFDTA